MKKIIFFIVLLFSFEANANLHRLHSFPKEWTDPLLKDLEPMFIEEYKEGFPEKYHKLKDSEKIFYMMWKLEKVGYDYGTNTEFSWYRVEKMPQNEAERYYVRDLGELPEEYYLIPRDQGKERLEFIQQKLTEFVNKRDEAEYQKKEESQNTAANLVGFVHPPMGIVTRILFALD